MLRFTNLGHAITIRLPQRYGYEGFSVDCFYKYDKNIEKYILSMWLKKNDIGDRFKIDAQEIDTQPVSGTRETIRDNICRIVEQACEAKYFDPYVERYNYTYTCFDCGDDLLSKRAEQLVNDDASDEEVLASAS